MKKTLVIILALGLFSAMPAIADHKKEVPPPEKTVTHIHKATDADCAKECDLLLSDCALQVDSIQQHIDRIKSAIKKEGAQPGHVEELRILNNKLKEANETLKALNKPGK